MAGSNNKLWLFLFSLFYTCLLFNMSLSSISLASAEQIPSVYIVKKGDTLWNIADQYLNDPLLWPNLWQNNAYIIDPQWIYPGQPLLLRERKLLTPEQDSNTDNNIERSVKVVKAPSPSSDLNSSLPQSSSTTNPPPSLSQYIADRDRIDSCGYILPEEEFLKREQQEKWGSIIDAKEKKISYSFLDLLYINNGKDEVSPGDTFTIFRRGDTVCHPNTNEKFGYLIHILGIAEVQEVFDKIALIKVIKSFSEIHLKDRITPYQQIPLPVRQEAKIKIQGILIASEDNRINLAENNIVFLDQGKNQQIQPGNYFSIFRQDNIFEEDEKEKKSPIITVNDIIGEVVVLKAEDNTSTALITKSKDAISVGYQFSAEP